MASTIIFNGQTYNSLEEMPPEARQAYEQAMAMLADNNQNGLPDVFEDLVPGAAQPGAATPGQPGATPPVFTTAATTISINGKTYRSLGEVPPEDRRAYEQAMGALDQNRNGLPDFMEGQDMSLRMMASPTWTAKAPPPKGATITPGHPAAASTGAAPGERAEATRRLVLFLGLGLLALALVAVVVWGGVFVIAGR